MAGHSQFKNIMHRKGAQDARRARLFNKLAREITVAAKGGSPEAAHNPRLRAALANARAANMTRERIDKAIKAAQPGGADASNFEDVRYEGYGPGGVALIVECLTDNRNRTAADIRAAFSKNGGNLGETNAVAFLFQRVGLVLFPAAVASAEQMLEAAAEAGADNAEGRDAEHEITCAPEALGSVRDALEARFGTPQQARLAWVPLARNMVTGAAAADLYALLTTLDEHDDVQNVVGNYEFAAAELEALAADA